MLPIYMINLNENGISKLSTLDNRVNKKGKAFNRIRKGGKFRGRELRACSRP